MTKVLIIDDSQESREIYSKALTESGFEVETAKNGKEGVEKMLANPPQLIFLDFVMPEMTGEEVLVEKAKYPSVSFIPVVMLTVVSAGRVGGGLLTAGPIASYLTKDQTTTADIVNKAKELLGSYGRPFDPKAQSQS